MSYFLLILTTLNLMSYSGFPINRGISDTTSIGNWERDTLTVVVDVTNPTTGRVWMDRNLGASHAATTPRHNGAYGDLYQWGRGADGHQKRISPTVYTLSTSDQPGHGHFIGNESSDLADHKSFDWRSPQNNNLWKGVNGVNNPCPVGYRLPTTGEWEEERNSWSQNNAAGAFASPLKLLSTAGRHSSGLMLEGNVAGLGTYWTDTVSESDAFLMSFDSKSAFLLRFPRSYGHSVRCIKD